MKKAEVKVSGPYGMHARVAFQFAKKSSMFKSSVKILKNGSSGDGKDVMDILALGVEPGSSIIIVAEGEDEASAIESLTHFMRKEAPSL